MIDQQQQNQEEKLNASAEQQLEQPSNNEASSSPETSPAALVIDRDSQSAASSAAGATANTDSASSSDIYHVKWIRHAGKQHPVVTQNVNGPCPLLAIANTLLLRGTISLPAGCDYVASQDLMQRLADALLETVTRQQQQQQQQQQNQTQQSSNTALIDHQSQTNLEQLVSDSLALFPRLQTGLDINIGFSAYSRFEYTPELDIFDRFNIELVHGWVLDPQQNDVAQFIDQLTYNQLVEKIITAKTGENQELHAQAIAAEEFLDSSSNQLTVFGLWQLIESLKEGALCVLFRNNHFSTLTKHKGQLYLLVTDQGYLHQPDVVWETLNNIDNDGSFVNADFRPSEIEPSAGYPVQSPSGEAVDQVEQDRQLALALQNQAQIPACGGRIGPSTQTDEQLALQLQREEEQMFQQQQQQQQQQQRLQQQQQRPSRQQQHQHNPPAAPHPRHHHQQQQQQQHRRASPAENNERSCTFL